ncbi:MAG TPA: DUF11 domain-containing protein, partial [Actinomycetes bacterium]|nr:DUF11 domain-containing protein [Actinomycetes bacterium]
APGDEFAYQINVANNGPDPAEGVVLVDSWPVGLDAPTNLEPGCGYNSATRKITCQVGAIRPHGVLILGFAARTNGAASGTLSNTATVDSATFDPSRPTTVTPSGSRPPSSKESWPFLRKERPTGDGRATARRCGPAPPR